ncbi:MAG: tRNA(His) guanylyltransferase Thg1 family protein [Prosthecobacter sp.]
MKFDDLDAKMRVYETEGDRHVQAGVFIVARVDGRGFTRLTKEIMRFEAPFDVRFRDAMAATARHLMDCGFRALHAFTQSDEISLLLHRDESSFQRKEHKLISVLAGEASAAITHALGRPACMDCRLCLLPTEALVVDYFRWRMEDARRNALNAHAYWLLRREGHNETTATASLEGQPVEAKQALLEARGIVFNDLPLWQRHGHGTTWRQVEKAGVDPRSNTATLTTRRKLITDWELPAGPEYGEEIRMLLQTSLVPERIG